MVAEHKGTFFISRAGADAELAKTVVRILNEAGHPTISQDHDFAGMNFVERMHDALAGGARVVALLSRAYLRSDYCAAEWMNALAGDPLNKKRRLIVLRAEECDAPGLLSGIAYWDLVPALGDPDRVAAIVLESVRNGERAPLGSVSTAFVGPQRPLSETIRIRPVPAFTGRGAELAEIEQTLEERGLAVVYGLGGTGKSTLAQQFAWRRRERYALVWRITADTESNVIDALLQFGDLFSRGLSTVKDRRAAARYVITGLLANWVVPVLLIFDNLESEELLRDWLPESGAHVVVTTRRSAWSAGIRAIQLSPLPIAEAEEYLQRESGRADLKPGDMRVIVETLGALPLALAHAAAYLKQTRTVTARTYLERIRHHMSEAPMTGENRRAVFATFKAALVDAEYGSAERPGKPGAASVACFGAMFAPDSVPEELFHQSAELYAPDLRPTLPGAPSPARDLRSTVEESWRIDEAIGELDRLSLITFTPEPRAFSMHRLVPAAARDAISQTIAWSSTAVAVINELFPNPAFENWAICERLLPHAAAALDALPQESESWAVSQLTTKCGEYSRARGSFAEAERWFRRALEIDERREGSDSINVAVDLSNLASLLFDINKLDTVEALFTRALKILDRPGTSASTRSAVLSHYTWYLIVMNRRDEADNMLAELREVIEGRVGADDAEIAIGLNNLSYMLIAQEKYDEGEQLLRRALDIKERVFGPNHPQLIPTLMNLLDVLMATGRTEKGESVIFRALDIIRTAYGPDHAEMARGLNKAAGYLHDVGRREEAESYFRRALAIKERLYDGTHPAIATTAAGLADLLVDLGKIDEAEVLARRAFEIDRRNYGLDHPDTERDAAVLDRALKMKGLDQSS